jgi:hypothetical protein
MAVPVVKCSVCHHWPALKLSDLCHACFVARYQPYFDYKKVH